MRSVLLVLTAVGLTGCHDIDFGSSDRYQTDFHYQWNLSPTGHVNVESFNGSIEISGWDENKVEVSGTKYASTEVMRDQLRIETHVTTDAVELRAVRPSGRSGNMGARFTIHVPRKAVLDRIVTSNGNIRVRDVASAAHLTTSNSSIRAENFEGGLDARTSNASIEVESVRGDLTLRTSNGRIRAAGVDGRVDVGTSNSSVNLAFHSSPKADVHAHSSNGGITVTLPSGTNARFDAETSNGSIQSDFDLAEKSEHDRHHLTGVLGTGGPVMELNTSNGSIHIQKGTAD